MSSSRGVVPQRQRRDGFRQLIRFDQAELLTNTAEVEISLINRLYASVRASAGGVELELWQRRYFEPDFRRRSRCRPAQHHAQLHRAHAVRVFDGPRRYSPVVSVFRAKSNRRGRDRMEVRLRPRVANREQRHLRRRPPREPVPILGHLQVHSDPIICPPAPISSAARWASEIRSIADGTPASRPCTTSASASMFVCDHAGHLTTRTAANQLPVSEDQHSRVRVEPQVRFAFRGRQYRDVRDIEEAGKSILGLCPLAISQSDDSSRTLARASSPAAADDDPSGISNLFRRRRDLRLRSPLDGVFSSP